MVPLTQIPPKIPFFHHLIAENQVLPFSARKPLMRRLSPFTAGTIYCADCSLTTYRDFGI